MKHKDLLSLYYKKLYYKDYVTYPSCNVFPTRPPHFSPSLSSHYHFITKAVKTKKTVECCSSGSFIVHNHALVRKILSTMPRGGGPPNYSVAGLTCPHSLTSCPGAWNGALLVTTSSPGMCSCSVTITGISTPAFHSTGTHPPLFCSPLPGWGSSNMRGWLEVSRDPSLHGQRPGPLYRMSLALGA